MKLVSFWLAPYFLGYVFLRRANAIWLWELKPEKEVIQKQSVLENRINKWMNKNEEPTNNNITMHIQRMLFLFLLLDKNEVY